MALEVAPHLLQNSRPINFFHFPLALRNLGPYPRPHSISLFFCVGWKKFYEAESKIGREGFSAGRQGFFTERHATSSCSPDRSAACWCRPSSGSAR